MAKLAAIASLCLAVPTEARRMNKPQHSLMATQLRGSQVESIPMFMHKKDCWQKRPHHRLALDQIPGAGMDPQAIKPFETVLKDGFFHVDCVKDNLLIHGDAHGDGKYDYKLGGAANVSIVHYTDIVAREDRKEMTPEVCFEFCRTVPDMLAFGLHNGRDCYCAPYFTAIAGDSSDCDAPCDGNPTQFCGGKTKSSIFSMHSCADSGANMKDAATNAGTIEGTLATSISDANSLSGTIKTAAGEMQKAFGANGVPSASNLMQSAVVHAGKLDEAVVIAEKTKTKLQDVVTEATGLEGGDFTKMDEAKKAEKVTNTLEKLITKAESSAQDLAELIEDSTATDAGDKAANLYYPIMYFVNKEFQNASAVCSGDAVKNPMSAASLGDCARACEAESATCVGFSFASSAGGGLCFLFSKFEEVTFFPSCATAFVQRHAKKASTVTSAKCMAKLSRFEGTSVKPDASGKCKTCLKKYTKSGWCPTKGGESAF